MSARSSFALLGAALAGSLAAWGCAQILGADEDRELLPDGVSLGGGEDDGGAASVPEAGDPNACPPDQKRCNGACVPRSPDYGCGGASCEPCSVPNAGTVVCKEGQCAAGTCKQGFVACGDAKDGCQSDITSPLTCTSCLVACNVDAGQVCTPSGCGADCGALTNCSGACVDRTKSVSHCGTCGKKCEAQPNGDPACVNGACTVTCRQGFAHCDGNPVGPCAALKVFYRDADGDGAGDVGQTKTACDQASAGAGWVPVAGDCHDGNPQVFPGQQAYFPAPYTTPGGAQSYDYDCNGIESDKGDFVKWTTCGGGCAADGIAAAGSGRVGAGVNDWCGSTKGTYCEFVDSSSGIPRNMHPLAPFCRRFTYAAPVVACR